MSTLCPKCGKDELYWLADWDEPYSYVAKAGGRAGQTIETTRKNHGNVNERGWVCVECDEQTVGEPPGFSPFLDRELIDRKAENLAQHLVTAGLISLPEMWYLELCGGYVAEKCNDIKTYDSYTVMQFVLECWANYDFLAHHGAEHCQGTGGHAAFWKNISDGVLAGNDPRDRCECGELATVYGDKNQCGACANRKATA